MRRCLCVVLLSCFLVVGTAGSLMAGEFTDLHAQQVLNAARSAQPNSKGVEVTLSIGGKNVVFTVIRDGLGNVTAQPVPGPDSAGITIGLIKLQLKSSDKGLLTPTSLQVVSTSNIVTSYSITYDAETKQITGISDGSGGSGGSGQGSANAKPLVGGIGGASGSLDDKDKDLPKDKYPDFKAGQLGLPAGTKPGESNREPSPSVP